MRRCILSAIAVVLSVIYTSARTVDFDDDRADYDSSLGKTTADPCLYDLNSDPHEKSNLYEDDDYADVVVTLTNKLEEWQALLVEPEVPDTAKMKAAWKSCGGVCSWIDSDYTPLQIEQTYFPSNPPHLVFVMVDDWGFNDVGYQSNYMSWTTPNIDRLAKEGVKLDNYYTHANSIPSRGAFLTGRYPIRLGLWDDSDDSTAELPLDEVTIAQELKRAGYRTYMVGSWYLGMSTETHHPMNRGFDYFYGSLTGSIDYYTKYYDDKYLDLYDGLELVSDEAADTHSVYLYQSKVEDILSEHSIEHSDEPMFLYYSLPLIRSPYTAPDNYLARCSKPTASDFDDDYTSDAIYNYCALNIMADEVIGNLTCTLDRLGYGNNTLLVVVSDNGGTDVVPGNNYPYHGSRGDHYRGALSVNAFLHGPVVPPEIRGSTYSGQVHVTDWLPTLLRLGTGGTWDGVLSETDGSEVPLDGWDQWSSLVNNTASPHLEMLHAMNGDEVSLQYDMYKLDLGSIAHSHRPDYYFEEDENPDLSRSECYLPSLVSNSYETTDDYIQFVLSQRSLFDLNNDPHETINVYNDTSYSQLRDDLEDRASQWVSAVMDPIVPSSYNKHKTWGECGGVCPWVGTDDDTDDDDDESSEVEVLYDYSDAPHVVFVLVDDWGWNDVGFRSTYLSWTTPHIDELAAEGVRLDNYYTHYSCVPSRGALLTGRYAIRLGLWAAREDAELPLNETTIAQEMKSAGYRTYMVGKWHMGFSTRDHTPLHRGFDSFYGYLNGYVDYWSKEYGGFLDLHEGDQLVTDATELSSDYHNGYLMQSKAEAAISDHATNYPDQPMFLYYAMQLIHGVWSAPPEYLARCPYPDPVEDLYIQDVLYNYCALNVMLDEAIANLTCALRQAGMKDNTVLIVASDNGGESTVEGNNYPFRGAKGSFDRGGVSGTAFIHGAMVPEDRRGQIYMGQMHVTDWLPTLMGLATGGTWDGSLRGAELDGVDMWDAIMGDQESPRETIVHYADGEAISMQYKNYKLDMGFLPPGFNKPIFNFTEDLNPDSAKLSCTSPSLEYDDDVMAGLSSSRKGANPYDTGNTGNSGNSGNSGNVDGRNDFWFTSNNNDINNINNNNYNPDGGYKYSQQAGFLMIGVMVVLFVGGVYSRSMSQKRDGTPLPKSPYPYQVVAGGDCDPTGSTGNTSGSTSGNISGSSSGSTSGNYGSTLRFGGSEDGGAVI